MPLPPPVAQRAVCFGGSCFFSFAAAPAVTVPNSPNCPPMLQCQQFRGLFKESCDMCVITIHEKDGKQKKYRQYLQKGQVIMLADLIFF